MMCWGRRCCEDKVEDENIDDDLEKEAEKYLARKELLQVGLVEEAIAALSRRGLQNNDPSRHCLACEAYFLTRRQDF
jgi:hypothetical protein